MSSATITTPATKQATAAAAATRTSKKTGDGKKKKTDAQVKGNDTMFIGAYVPSEIKIALEKNKGSHFRTLSQEIVKGLTYYIESINAGRVAD